MLSLLLDVYALVLMEQLSGIEMFWSILAKSSSGKPNDLKP